MLWDEETWKKMQGRMLGAARAMGAQEADAEDMASKAALALLERVEKSADPENPVEIDNPAAYMRGALRNIGKSPVNRHHKEDILEDPHASVGLACEVDQGEPVAIDHAVAVEKEVWQGRNFGESGFMFMHTHEHVPEDEDLDDLTDQLKRLWKWEDGGELVLTITEPRRLDLRVTAREKAFLVEAPTGEQCFGAPLPREADEILREVFKYDPPDEEMDCNYTILDPERAENVGDVANFLLGTLEHVYGWDPDDGVEWECEYDSWEE